MTLPATTTRQGWASALVARFNPEVPAETVSAVEAWTIKEGGAGPQWAMAGNVADYNPLNNTLRMPGSRDTPGNEPPVQAYVSWEQGLEATEAVIRQPNMAGIAQSLSTGATCGELSVAVAGSPWGTGSFASLCPGSIPTKEELLTMPAVVTPDGKIKVYAVAAGDRAGQLLEFTRDPADPTHNSVIDVTDQIGGPDPYTVSAV